MPVLPFNIGKEKSRSQVLQTLGVEDTKFCSLKKDKKKSLSGKEMAGWGSNEDSSH